MSAVNVAHQVDFYQMRVLIGESEFIRLSDNEHQIMENCLRISAEINTGVIHGKLCCIWGLIPPTLLSDQAYLWLYTTEAMKDHEFLFVRHSQKELERILKEYSSIVGFVHADAETSKRWLKWLGAVFGEPDGKRIPFRIRKK